PKIDDALSAHRNAVSYRFQSERETVLAGLSTGRALHVRRSKRWIAAPQPPATLMDDFRRLRIASIGAKPRHLRVTVRTVADHQRRRADAAAGCQDTPELDPAVSHPRDGRPHRRRLARASRSQRSNQKREHGRRQWSGWLRDAFPPGEPSSRQPR